MKNNQILTQLHACAAVCNICFETCLEDGAGPGMARCLELTRDCSELCLLAASFLARGSLSVDSMLRLVAETCDACAAACGTHDMEHCRRCREVCLHTASACRLKQAA